MRDESEFSGYAERAWPSLVRSAVFLGCSPADAEDAAQAALIKCYTKWERVSDADDRDAYVYRVLINCVHDLRRRRRWREHPTADLPDTVSPATVDEIDAIDTVDSIHRAMECLTKANRDVVVLRYFAQLSEAQTAEALGIAAGTVKSRLSRALAKLAANSHLAETAASLITPSAPREPETTS